VASEQPVVAVVVPTHDRPDLLHRTLLSVLWQRDVPFEVVVVDDGEAQLGAAFVADLADERVRAVPSRTPHGGPCAARNVGAAASSAPWIAYVDDDDLWAPDKLSAQLAAARALPGARWVTSGAAIVDDDLVVRAYQPPPPPGWQPRQLAVNLVPGGGSGTVLTRELVEEVGGFDETLRHHGDYEMWVRASLASPLAVVDRPLTGYLRHSGGLSRGTTGGRRAYRQMAPRLAELRAQHGVAEQLDEWQRLWADLELRSGRRWEAARSYLGLGLRHRRPSVVARAALSAVAPGAAARRAQRWEQASLPDAARSEAMTWIDELRRVSAAASAG
jgi:hypothetical protein